MSHTELTGTAHDSFDAIIRETGEPVKVTKEYVGTQLVLRGTDGKSYTDNADGSVTELDSKAEDKLSNPDTADEGAEGNFEQGQVPLNADEIDAIQGEQIPPSDEDVLAGTTEEGADKPHTRTGKGSAKK